MINPYIQARVGGRVDAWDETGAYVRCEEVGYPEYADRRFFITRVRIDGEWWATSAANIIYLVELEVAS